MEFLTNDKLTIVGAAGMIGSNMAQTAIMMHLTPNIPAAPTMVSFSFVINSIIILFKGE